MAPLTSCIRFLLLPFLLALLLAVQYSSFNGVLADENPQGEVNLNKNTAYNNALKCLESSSLKICPAGSTLNETGVLYVNASISKQYCSEGCANQTIVALSCISNVVNDFRFNNAATISDVTTAIQTGCTTGNFTVKASPNGANMNRAYWGSFWMLFTLFATMSL